MGAFLFQLNCYFCAVNKITDEMSMAGKGITERTDCHANAIPVQIRLIDVSQKNKNQN